MSKQSKYDEIRKFTVSECGRIFEYAMQCSENMLNGRKNPNPMPPGTKKPPPPPIKQVKVIIGND